MVTHTRSFDAWSNRERLRIKKNLPRSLPEGQIFLESVNCQLCAGNKTQKLLSIGEFCYVKCLNCNLVYLNPRPDKEFFDKMYKGESAPLASPPQAPVKEENIYLSRFADKLKGINRFHKNKGKILDIGCAWGYFLTTAKKDGWDTYGVELSLSEVKYAQERFNIKAFIGQVTEARFPGEHFDAITLWHVFEHMPYPLTVLSELRRILKKEGLLVIEVPSLKMLKEDIRIAKFDSQHPPYHLFYYDNATLRRLLEKAGFQIVHQAGCGNTRVLTAAKSLNLGFINDFAVKYYRYLKGLKKILQGLRGLLQMQENIIVYARPIPTP